jgi:REP element-mobilizing transposase RayT
MISEWHSRGYIPHWEAGEVAQSITFRLADSLPKTLLEDWQVELESMPQQDRALERRRRIEHALDRGLGSSVLMQPDIGGLVEDALLYFDGDHYRLHAWVIMPNHVHVLATPLEGWSLSAITHGWKSFTASKANAMLGRKGAFWAPEYFDRAIRDETHYANSLGYIAVNPVKARLCARPEDWRFSSFWGGRKDV